MKKLLWAGGLMLLFVTFSCKTEIYKDASKSIDERANDLLSKMTLDEKLKLISGDTSGFDTPEIPRLGIPAIHLTDGPIGVRWGNATSFPSGVATAASWDTILIKELAKAMAIETKAKGRVYLLGPCVCIQRMPLGGRNFETYSEDPYLTSRLAVNWIKGLQGEKVISSVKHFAVNDQEWERHNYDVIIDERALREIHLPAFEAAIKEGDAMTLMSAYNIVNGQHCSENYHLLSDILKKEWGFKGFVVSDWTSVYSTVNAANAGLDLEMPKPIYFNPDSIKKYINEGKITEAIIDDKVRRILRVAFWAGLFEKRENTDTSVLHSDAHKMLALKAAQEGITLLKNENILPINPTKVKTIAIIGPNAANAVIGGGGSSHVDPYYSVTPLEGIKKRFGNSINILYATGDSFPRMDITPIKSEFFLTPDKKENGLQGEYFTNKNMEGTPFKVRIDKDVNFDFKGGSPMEGIYRNFFSIRWTGYLKVDKTGDYTISTLSDDGVKLYIDDKLVLQNWNTHGEIGDEYNVSLTAGKEYKIKLEYYEESGSAVIKLGLRNRIASSVDPIQYASDIAAKADVAVIFIGSIAAIESEGTDRESMNLPGKQEQLIKEVLKKNKNTIVVINGATPVKLDPWIKDVKGLIDMYFVGQETGNAIASILSGDVNPSGKLPFSYIKDESQSPAFKEYKDKGLKIHYNEGIFVGYRFLEKEKKQPAFPFGFGLSYTTFKYSNIKIEKLSDKSFEVKADISNTGKVEGSEVAQLYISDLEASVPRPVKELKGFSKVQLQAGETKTVSFKLKARDFAFWDTNSNDWKIEPGEFEVLVGSSSADILLKEKLKIE